MFRLTSTPVKLALIGAGAAGFIALGAGAASADVVGSIAGAPGMAAQHVTPTVAGAPGAALHAVGEVGGEMGGLRTGPRGGGELIDPAALGSATGLDGSGPVTLKPSVGDNALGTPATNGPIQRINHMGDAPSLSVSRLAGTTDSLVGGGPLGGLVQIQPGQTEVTPGIRHHAGGDVEDAASRERTGDRPTGERPRGGLLGALLPGGTPLDRGAATGDAGAPREGERVGGLLDGITQGTPLGEMTLPLGL
ncbi:hypothetical protein ACQEU5_07825 [Marinactinospora thermotolerans]|uniref:GLTT repeat-containing protein n=1 Tax=Marinactinospora thermotolerans DSM 45154 TaxID=1122192 RepID=A0A1T4R799_9ACTN|nr:hypothetical protein [Marinactinospora thermotolerans]SKA11696.1 hypothetical protein SAMN02745673_02570 [Marinactinospora thermotolerans DSM 45154]